MPTKGAIPPIDADWTNKVPTIGPVHENETNAKVNAIKKIPIKPPLLEAESALFTQELGNTISNAPKNEIAKTINNKKKKILKYTLVDNAFKCTVFNDDYSSLNILGHYSPVPPQSCRDGDAQC